MLFALICNDRPNSLELRKSVRERHLAFLESLGDGLKFAGPFLDGDDRPNGSLVVIAAPNLDAAKAIAAKDPYAEGGLFADVTIRPWNWAVKNPDAG